MSTDERYNGWTNYETWCVALWINNDQGWQESVHAALRVAAEDHYETQREGCTDCVQGSHSADCGTDLDALEDFAPWRAGEIVRENVEQVVCFDFGREDDTMPANLSSDLVGRALDRVDWDELGATFLSDLAEQDQ